MIQSGNTKLTLEAIHQNIEIHIQVQRWIVIE